MIESLSFTTTDLIFKVQLYSEKCTGRYFKVRDLSSKQGSLCTFKTILKKMTQKYF